MNQPKITFLTILLIWVSGIIAVWISYVVVNIVLRVLLVSACIALSQFVLRKIK